MKTKKSKLDPFEYEDYGTPSMYIWAVFSIILMVAIVIIFGMIVAGGVVAISEVIK